jgi:hypothetical protein
LSAAEAFVRGWGADSVVGVPDSQLEAFFDWSPLKSYGEYEKKKGDEKRLREYLRKRHNRVMLLW